jgi:hypothetical protein
LFHNAGGGVRRDMPRLLPCQPVRNAIQESAAYIARARGVDGPHRHTFDGDDLSFVHQNGTIGPQGQCHVLGMSMNLAGALDGVVFPGQAARLFEIAEQQVDRPLNQSPELVPVMVDQKRVRDGECDLHVVLFG